MTTESYRYHLLFISSGQINDRIIFTEAYKKILRLCFCCRYSISQHRDA